VCDCVFSALTITGVRERGRERGRSDCKEPSVSDFDFDSDCDSDCGSVRGERERGIENICSSSTGRDLQGETAEKAEFNGEIRENLLFSVKSHGLKWPNKLRCRTSAVVEPLSTIPPT
jgi:hypothetical protein